MRQKGNFLLLVSLRQHKSLSQTLPPLFSLARAHLGLPSWCVILSSQEPQSSLLAFSPVRCLLPDWHLPVLVCTCPRLSHLKKETHFWLHASSSPCCLSLNSPPLHSAAPSKDPAAFNNSPGCMWFPVYLLAPPRLLTPWGKAGLICHQFSHYLLNTIPGI